MPKRTNIRTNLKTACEEIEGMAPESILLGRQRSIPQIRLPALAIYTENEEKQTAHIGPPRAFDRSMDLIFEIHLQANTVAEVEALLDSFCEKLETALLADETLGGLTEEIIPVLDEYNLEEDSRSPGGVAQCRYSIKYTD